MVREQCRHLTIDRLHKETTSKPSIAGWSHGFLTLHSTFEGLASEARNGCETCKIFHQTFLNDYGGEAALLERRAMKIESSSSSPIIAFLNTRTKTLPSEKRPIRMLFLQIGTAPQQPGQSNITITFRISKPRGVTVRPSAEYGFRYTHLDHDLGSEENFAIARNWITSCSKEHDKHLCPSITDNDLPTRLIDVGSSNGDEEPRLVQPSKGHKGKYLALSHCWGPSTIKERLLTTEATLQARLDKIPLVSMPANFRDAVIITRKLGHRYLWIDSLCIIQDSKTDWKTESANMGNIYTNASLTIAAAAAKDSDGGLPQKDYYPQESGGIFAPSYGFMVNRKQLNIYALPDQRPETNSPASSKVSCHIKMCEDEDDGVQESVILGPWLEFSDIEENFFRCTVVGPLAHRGWCLQERLLSHRILYYGVRQIYWQCASSREAADGEVVPVNSATSAYTIGNGASEWPDLLGLKNAALTETNEMKPNSALQKSEFDKKIYKTWHNILFLYVNRRLTYSSDRLPGLAGMATLIGKLTGDVYVAGFWRRSLLISLVWTHIPISIREHEFRHIAEGYEIPEPQWEFKKREYDGPSWSWASAAIYDKLQFWPEHNAEIQLRIWKTQDAEIVGVEVELADKGDPYGAIKSGSLVLKGFVRRKYDTRVSGWNPYNLFFGIIFSCCPFSSWNQPPRGRAGNQHALWDYGPRQEYPPFPRVVLHILAWMWFTIQTMIWEWRFPTSYPNYGASMKCHFCREYLRIHVLSLMDKTPKMTKSGEMAHEVDIWSLILESVPGQEDTFRRVGISSEVAYMSEEEFEVSNIRERKRSSIPEAFADWKEKTVTII